MPSLHPGDGSSLGRRRAGDHTLPAKQTATAEDLPWGWGDEQFPESSQETRSHQIEVSKVAPDGYP